MSIEEKLCYANELHYVVGLHRVIRGESPHEVYLREDVEEHCLDKQKVREFFDNLQIACFKGDVECEFCTGRQKVVSKLFFLLKGKKICKFCLKKELGL